MGIITSMPTCGLMGRISCCWTNCVFTRQKRRGGSPCPPWWRAPILEVRREDGHGDPPLRYRFLGPAGFSVCHPSVDVRSRLTVRRPCNRLAYLLVLASGRGLELGESALATPQHQRGYSLHVVYPGHNRLPFAVSR